MSLLVVGSVAYDGIETPFGKTDRILGGSATYISLASSFFAENINLVGVVGKDFADEDIELFKSKHIDLEGLQVDKSGNTFFWKGKYHHDLNMRDTLDTQLNVFEHFDPIIPDSYKDADFVALGNIEPSLQHKVLEQVTDPRLVVDGYLNYVVENWIEDNKLAIENGLRAEIAESFMGALKGVFTEHYVEVPDSKIDVVDELATKVDRLEDELNESVKKSMTLKEKVQDLTRERVITEASDDLTASQAEKLRKLAEGVDFENEETFADKVETIKESYFTESTSSDNSSEKTILEDTSIDADVAEEQENVSPAMSKYLSALRKTAR